MKKYDFCILNIKLIFSITLFLFFVVNPNNAQTYFNPSVGYGGGYGLYGPTSWRTPVADFLAGYGISSYSTGTPYYPFSWNQTYNYSFSHGNPYNPNDPLYGTVPLPPISIPSEIMNMLASSNWNTAQMGINLARPYFQAAVMSGWTPWVSPYSNPQTYYKYGPISPISGAPPGMAYDSYNRSFYIPGQYVVGYPGSYYR